MKRIAIVYGTLVQGGVDKALLTMLKMLDYSNYCVTLYLENDSGPLQPLIDKRVNVKVWDKRDNIIYSSYFKELLNKGKIISCVKSLWYRSLAHLFINDLQRNERYSFKSQAVDLGIEQYDVVIAYQALSYWHLLYARNHIESKKHVGWIHGNMKYMEDEDKTNLPKLFKWFDNFVCVSNSVRDNFLYYSPKLEKKTSVIYNLFDIDEIKKKANRPIEEHIEGLSFVTVGRISYEKGQKMIPSIAKKLVELGYEFTWYVVGDGLDYEIVKQQIKDFALDDTVVLTGMKDNPYPYMKRCSLYIQPSFTEGFCLSTFEAKILGKHIVVTDVPGMREQFGENEAVFCEPTVPSLVNGIRRAIDLLDKPVNYKEETDEFNKTQLTRIDKLLSS